MKHIKKLILFIVIALSTACSNKEDIITIDTHIDINVENFTNSLNYTMNTNTQFNLPNMMEGDLDVAWLVVYTAQGELNEEVVDVICSEGRLVNPSTNQCSPIDTKVDLTDCSFDKSRGAKTLKAL